MTKLRYVPINLEGGKIIHNRGKWKTNVRIYKKPTKFSQIIIFSDLEAFESSLEYEETFVEKFYTRSSNWKEDTKETDGEKYFFLIIQI